MVVEKVIIVSVHIHYFSFFSFFQFMSVRLRQVTSGYVRLRQFTSVYVSLCQFTSVYVSLCTLEGRDVELNNKVSFEI